MNDASRADIRILASTPIGNEIATSEHLDTSDYEEKFETLSEQNRYLVSDQQLNRLEASHTIATDF